MKYFEITLAIFSPAVIILVNLEGRLMADTTDLAHRLESRYPRMSKGHKRICEYITQNFDKAAFMTAHKLGERTQVSESTVCALCRQPRL